MTCVTLCMNMVNSFGMLYLKDHMDIGNTLSSQGHTAEMAITLVTCINHGKPRCCLSIPTREAFIIVTWLQSTWAMSSFDRALTYTHSNLHHKTEAQMSRRFQHCNFYTVLRKSIVSWSKFKLWAAVFPFGRWFNKKTTCNNFIKCLGMSLPPCCLHSCLKFHGPNHWKDLAIWY